MKNNNIGATCRKIRVCKLTPASSSLIFPFAAKLAPRHCASMVNSAGARMESGCSGWSSGHAIARNSSHFAAKDRLNHSAFDSARQAFGKIASKFF
jgi:hypothetical protein